MLWKGMEVRKDFFSWKWLWNWKKLYLCSRFQAQVVKLVDTPLWGGGADYGMQVRLLSWALIPSPDGGIGRRVRFRCVYREVCRFDSCSGHAQQKSLTLKINELGFFISQKSPCRVNHVSTDFQKFAQSLTPTSKMDVKNDDFFLSVDTDFASLYP